MTHKYQISGMHCEACVAKVKAALEKVSGVTSAEVTLKPPQAVVTTTSELNEEALKNAVASVGYKLNREVEVGDKKNLSLKQYTPLFIISAYLLGGTFLHALSLGDFSLRSMMHDFMGGFFVIFSFFKMLDRKGFAEAFSAYDIIAKRFFHYGLYYPFIELSLGVLYLFRAVPFLTNLVTLILMIIGSVGVLESIFKKRKIQCACLGTIFSFPVSTVTLGEDLLMGVMAAMMLLLN